MSLPWQGGKQEKLTDYDIPRIGHTIDVGEDEVHAVLDVESKGNGFDKHGVIRLFEEHVFYRQLPKALRREAVKKGLAYPKWRRNYKNNYTRFLKAYKFHSEAALMACSWGLGQVMGFNYRVAGYSTVEQMVEVFTVSEAYQLEAMIEFIKSNNLDDELRNHDWSGFARGYNGKGYKRNRYDERLRARYNWWRSKPDTPWSPEAAKREEINSRPDPVSPLLYECCYRFADKVYLAYSNDVKNLKDGFWVDSNMQFGEDVARRYWIMTHMIRRIKRLADGHLEDM